METSNKKSKSDTSQDGSPSRQRKSRKVRSSKSVLPATILGQSSSGRSFSLTDLSHEMNQRVEMLSTLSATELSPRTLGSANDPSSSTTSSIATIVAHPRHDQEIDPRFLDAFADPSSLPVEFYGALSQITQ